MNERLLRIIFLVRGLCYRVLYVHERRWYRLEHLDMVYMYSVCKYFGCARAQFAGQAMVTMVVLQVMKSLFEVGSTDMYKNMRLVTLHCLQVPVFYDPYPYKYNCPLAERRKLRSEAQAMFIETVATWSGRQRALQIVSGEPGRIRVVGQVWVQVQLGHFEWLNPGKLRCRKEGQRLP